MSLIEYKKLGDIVNFKRGYDLPTQDRTEGGYPILSSSGISGYHSEYKVKGEGVIIGRYGTLGEPYYVNEKYWPHNTTLYVTDFKGNYPKYVYYLLKCLGKIKTSDKSAVPGVNRNELHEMVVPCVIQSHQKKIAAVLSALDAKIDVNNRINAELEKLAKTIYDYWFVQFDFPNEDGKPYKASGGKMVYNDQLKRHIPAAWEVKNLDQLGNFKNGVNYDPSQPGNTRAEIINVRDISNSSIYVQKNSLDKIYLKEKEIKNYSLNNRSILIARSGIPGATRLIDDYSENTIYCGFIICFEVNNRILRFPLFFLLQNLEKITGSQSAGTIIKNVNQATLKNLKIALPPTDRMQIIYNLFDCKISPLFKKINSINQQNQQLTQLRDWLLPLLMNGQVRLE